jgi:hypothetical protein
MFDVLNKITVDALIKPKSQGERELASLHFLKLMPQDLILLDRGYLHDTPSHALFKRERRAFSHGCIRMDRPA